MSDQKILPLIANNVASDKIYYHSRNNLCSVSTNYFTSRTFLYYVAPYINKRKKGITYATTNIVIHSNIYIVEKRAIFLPL